MTRDYYSEYSVKTLESIKIMLIEKRNRKKKKKKKLKFLHYILKEKL